jgi:hypothetical protein
MTNNCIHPQLTRWWTPSGRPLVCPDCGAAPGADLDQSHHDGHYGIDAIQVGVYRWLVEHVGCAVPIFVVAVGIIALVLFF